MNEDRTIHDEAWRCASILVANLKPIFMASELQDAHELIYETVRAAMEAAFIKRAREIARLNPSNN